MGVWVVEDPATFFSEIKVRFLNRPQVGFSFRNLMQWVQLDVPQLAEVW